MQELMLPRLGIVDDWENHYRLDEHSFYQRPGIKQKVQLLRCIKSYNN